MQSNRYFLSPILISMLVFATLILGACGGGGGDDDDVPGECRSYCRFACAKIGVCRGFTADQIDICRNECVDTILDDGLATATSCTNATNGIANATCAQLEQIFGFRNLSEMTVCESPNANTDCNPQEAGISLGLYSENN